ncbi:MAG: hypothetical protein FJX61_06380 [Alphaproteobacteria bacterium]|nr:hypothetical protein [Alphaproteobacteria bacterium]
MTVEFAKNAVPTTAQAVTIPDRLPAIVRRANGVIDTGHYEREAVALRGAALDRLIAGALAWFRR